MKKLVNSAISNKIYYATVNEKNRTISGEKKDVTDDAIMCVFQWFMTELERSEEGSVAFEITYPDVPFVLTLTKKEEK